MSFDPNQPYELIDESQNDGGGGSRFDPGKPYQLIGDSDTTAPAESGGVRLSESPRTDGKDQPAEVLSPMAGLGATMKILGGVAKGGLQDVAENIYNRDIGALALRKLINGEANDESSGILANTKAALNQDKTPYEEKTEDVGGVPGFLKNVSSQITQMVPQLLIAKGTGDGGISTGTVFGITEKGFDPVEGVKMAALHPISELGGTLMLKTLGKLGVNLANGVAENAYKALGGLIASQAYLDATSLPEYAKMTPEERMKHFIEGFGVNLGFHLAGIPGMVQEGISKNQVNEAAKQEAQKYRDAFWKAQQATPPVAASATETPEQFAQRIAEGAKGYKPKPVTEDQSNAIQEQSPGTVGVRNETTVRQEMGEGNKPEGATVEAAEKPSAGAPQEEAVGIARARFLSSLPPLEFKNQFKPSEGDAYLVGLSIKSPEELQELQDMQNKAVAEGKAFMQAKDYNSALVAGSKSQYFREAYEAATGTGSAGKRLREKDPNYKPPFPPESQPAFETPKTEQEFLQTVEKLRDEKDTGGRFNGESLTKYLQQVLGMPESAARNLAYEGLYFGKDTDAGYDARYKVADLYRKQNAAKISPQPAEAVKEVTPNGHEEERQKGQELLSPETEPPPVRPTGGETPSEASTRELLIKRTKKSLPVSAVAVDRLQFRLPPGYILDGDFYVREIHGNEKEASGGIGQTEHGFDLIDKISGNVGKIYLYKPRGVDVGRRAQLARKEKLGGLTMNEKNELSRLRERMSPPKGTEGYYNSEAYKEALELAPELFSASGEKPDSVVDALRREHLVGQDFDADALWDGIISAAKAREGSAESTTHESKHIAEEMEQHAEFQRVAMRNKQRNTEEQQSAKPVSAGELAVGDKFKLKGEELTVTEYNPDTGFYVVEDGRRFGKQYLDEHAQFYPDKGQVERIQLSDDAAFSVGDDNRERYLSISKTATVPQFETLDPNRSSNPERTRALQAEGRALAEQARKLVSTMPMREDGSIDFRRSTIAQLDALFETEFQLNDIRRQIAHEYNGPGIKYPPASEFLERVRQLDEQFKRANLPTSLEGMPIREGLGMGPEAIRKLIVDRFSDHPMLVKVALAMLDTPAMNKLDWSKLQLRVENNQDYAGFAQVRDRLIGMTQLANEKTFPHEVFHFLYEMLPENYKQAVNEARLAELKTLFGDKIPTDWAQGTLRSNDFLAQYTPESPEYKNYHLINPSEYLAEIASDRFSKEAWEKRNQVPASVWQRLQGVVSSIKDWVKGVVNAIRGVRPESPTMDTVYKELLTGKWKPNPKTAMEFEGQQNSLARTPNQYDRQRIFRERLVAERTIGAYGDMAEMKRRMADALGVTEAARRIVRIAPQKELLEQAYSDLGRTIYTLDNYDAMRAATASADPGAKWSVIQDAYHALGFEQRRMLRTRELLDKQFKVVTSQSFRDKLKQVAIKDVENQLRESTKTTYLNQISQEAGDVLREIKEKGKTDAQYEQLREDLDRLSRLKDFNSAIEQRVQDIVDTVSSTPEGLDLLYKGGDRTGTKIYNLYVDIKKSIEEVRRATEPRARGSGLTPFDQQFLSAADRAQLERSSLPLLTEDHKAFAKLAAGVLSANGELSRRLVTVSFFKHNPDFTAKVTKIGEDFRKLYENDPNKAVDKIVRMASKLTEKSKDAEAAWLRLHNEIMPELRKYEALRQAVEIDSKVTESPEWKALVNRIHDDAQAIRIPDSELKEVESGNVWNEFTGRQNLRSPNGAQYNLELGFTRKSAEKAQDTMVRYLADVRTWLDDPANADSPDRRYWQRNYDFVDNVLNVSTVLSPTSTIPLGGLKGSWTIPEFFFKSASMPAAKLTFTAFNNFTRSWVLADQWYNAHSDKMMNAIIRGAKSHKLDVHTQIRDYQEDVLDRIAAEYRKGNALAAGDLLNNGIAITSQDMHAFLTQGQAINELFKTHTNLGREKVMVNGILMDEWAKNVFGLRGPQELGAKPGTTLPREFSGRARALARLVHEIPVGDYEALSRLFDSEKNFDSFVTRFLAERGSDYSEVTPFEDIYRDIASKIKHGSPDAPQTVSEVVDYLEANTTGEYDRNAIEQIFIGGMERELRKFYDQYIAKEDTTDVRAIRASKTSSFNTGHTRDVGSSFYYDYGAVTAPEMRSLAIDSTNFHLVRLAKSLAAAEQDYINAMAQLRNSVDKQKATEEGMKRFHSGEDYRNWERLNDELRQLQYFKENVPLAYGSQNIQAMELFSNFNRLVGDFVSGALSGPGTSMNVLIGSATKMGLILGGMERFYMGAYSKGLISTLMSAVGIPARVALQTPGAMLRGYKAGTANSIRELFAHGLADVTEGLFRQGKFFNQQYQYGLGFKNPVGFRIANALLMPYSHGRGYDAKLSRFAPVRGLQKLGYRALSVAEAPLEVVKAYFPQLAYAISYDAAARAAGWTLDGIAAQARRSFDYLERTGQLGRYDLEHPSNLQNIIPAEMIIPRGIFKKTQTNLNFARDWFQRAIDKPLNELVIEYWKRLQDTAPEKRGEVSFLAADEKDPGKVRQMEDARGGALMSILLKDVHHASPENRPLELRKDSTLRFLFPIMGWFAQSTRGVFQALGRAPTDPKNTQLKLRLAAVATIMAFAASSVMMGETEKKVKKALVNFLFHEEYPAKGITEAHDGTELAKIAGLNVTSFIPILHDMFATLLGEKAANSAGVGVQLFTVDKLNSLLSYLNGVINTGDPTYRLATLGKVMFPFARTFIAQMESQKGLIAERNIKVLARKFGPPELVEKAEHASHSVSTPTPLSPSRQALANAIYAGDMGGAQEYFNQFVQKAVDMGRTPEEARKLAMQTVSNMNPYQQAFGQKLTEKQRQDFLAAMSPESAAQVMQAEGNYQQALSALGSGSTITKPERGPGGGGTGGGGASGGYGSLRPASSNIRASRSMVNRIRANRIAMRQPSSMASRPSKSRNVKLKQPISRLRNIALNRVRHRMRG